ncbi:MAG TPA: alpha-2-macroglobulin family protein [Spirochaetota bacterium]|nr:alpha-2-macroglobulin family protein [Spirochaetota bacterium]HOM09297.1 alpha-2-macroglobulin family protein [Spirochaetota bacterium]HPP49310.1 alpha-2-macroglobulin family protein [Spirochaetota bacterium]
MTPTIQKGFIAVMIVLVICFGITTAYVLNTNEIKLTIDYDNNTPYTELSLQFSRDIFIVSDIDAMKNDIAQKLTVSFNPELEYILKPLDSRNCILEIYNPKPAHEYQFTIIVKNIDTKGLYVTANNKEIELGKTYFFRTPVLRVYHCSKESKMINSPIVLQFNFPVSLNVLMQKMSIRPDVQYTLEYDSNDTSHKTVIVKPINEKKAQKYSLTIDKTMVPASGVIGMDTSYTFTYTTYFPFELTDIQSSYSRYYDDSSYYPDYPVEFTFNNEIALPQGKSVSEFVTVTPDPGGLQVNMYGNTIVVSGNFTGKKTYTVTIAQTLQDIYGQTLQEPVETEIEFEHAFSYFSCPTGYMLLENYLEKIIPLRMVNVSSFECRYLSLVNENDIKAYFESPKEYFNKHAKTKTYILNWTWDVYKTVKFDYSKLHQGDNGIFVYELKPVMEHPYENNHDVYRGMMQLSDIGVTIKKTKNDILVHVRDLLNNKALAGASLFCTGAEVSLGQTDAKGVLIVKNNGCSLFTIKHGKSIFYYSMQRDNGYSDEDERAKINLPEKYYGSDYYILKPQVHLFTDRYLYRPGETVHVKGILRYRNNDQWSIKPPLSVIKNVILTVINSRDEEIASSARSVSATGGIEWDIALKEDYPTGYYRITVSSSNKDYDLHQSIDFQVEEFKPAKAEMKIIPSKLTFLWGEILSVDLFGWYLFGAPVNNDVEYTVTLQPVTYRSSVFADYSFSTQLNYYDEYDEYSPPSTVVASGKVKVNEKGIAKVHVPLKAIANVPNAEILITGRTYLSDDSPVFGAKSGLTVAEPVHVGIKVPRYFNYTKEPVTIQLVACNNDDTVVEGTPIKLVIKKHEWKSFQIAGVNGRLQWEYKKIETEVNLQNHTIGKKDVVATINDPGYYTAEAYDSQGKRKYAVCDFYVLGKGEAGWRVNDDETVDVETDKKSYNVGETAMLLVKNPFTKAQAFVSIEREKFYDYFEVPATSSVVMIPVKITKEHIPNIYVSVMLYSGRTGFNALKDGEDRAKPRCLIGYARIKVTPKEKKLSVQVKPDKKQYEPGGYTTVELLVKDYKGQPVDGEATISIADRGVLNLVNYTLPDPYEYFYAPRQLAVTTFDVHQIILGQRYLKEKGELIGGDGGIASMGMIVPRADIRFSAYYKATVVVKQGKAKVQCKLPDNLTSFKSMVVVHTEDSKFGYGEATFEVKKPLMLLPTFPRFVRVGDTFNAGALVFNYTGKQGNVTIGLELKNGLKLKDGSAVAVKELILNNGQSQEVTFPVTVTGQAGMAGFTVKAQAGTYTDGITDTIPIKAPNVFETVAQYGRISAPQSREVQEITITRNIIPEVSSINIFTSPSAFVDLKGCLDYLVDYPYGCFEQKASKILPLILGQDIIVQKGLLKTKSKDELRKVVTDVLKEFPAYYKNGGFSYWKDGSLPSSYLTVYAAFIMTMAKKRGYDVDNAIYNDTIKVIKQFVKKGNIFSHEGRNSSWYTYTTLAFAHYVAALQGFISENELKLVYSTITKKYDDCIAAYAYLLKALALYPDSTLKKTLVKEIAEKFFSRMRTESGYVYFTDTSQWGYFYYDTVLSTALILQALLEANIPFNNDYKIVQYLLKQRKGYAWLNTHQNAVVWWALNSYLVRYEKDKPDYSLQVLVDTKELLNAIVNESNVHFAKQYIVTSEDSGVKKFSFIKNGKGACYFTMQYQYIPVYEAMTSKNMGFEVSKLFKDIKTKETVKTFKKGSEYIVEITVYTPKDRGITVLEDQLPSGFEPVNVTFATEEKVAVDKKSDYTNWGTFNHYEQYSDRIIYYADFIQRGTHKVIFKVRATNSGTFKLPACKVEEMYNPEVFGILYFSNTVTVE